MIDWRHPRIYERLRCFGLCLFTLCGRKNQSCRNLESVVDHDNLRSVLQLDLSAAGSFQSMDIATLR
jgi:hypothetical protein